MPLKETNYGGECPLGIFKIDVGGGAYTADTLESCLGHPEFGGSSCNYIKSPGKNEEFDPAVQCMCPADMTKAESRRLKNMYASLIDQGKADKTKEGFWKFVEENHKKELTT